jgi:hypothetical protein
VLLIAICLKTVERSWLSWQCIERVPTHATHFYALNWSRYLYSHHNFAAENSIKCVLFTAVQLSKMCWTLLAAFCFTAHAGRGRLAFPEEKKLSKDSFTAVRTHLLEFTLVNKDGTWIFGPKAKESFNCDVIPMLTYMRSVSTFICIFLFFWSREGGEQRRVFNKMSMPLLVNLYPRAQGRTLSPRGNVHPIVNTPTVFRRMEVQTEDLHP